MKTSKVSRVIIAGVVSLQALVSHAETSRVDGIGERQIEAAQQNLSDMHKQMSALSTQLDALEASIKNRDELNRTDYAVIAASGLGLFASLYLKSAIRSVQHNDGVIERVVEGIALSVGLTVGAAIGGMEQKPNLNTESIESDVKTAEKAIMAQIRSNKNKEITAQLMALNIYLKGVTRSIDDYKANQNKLNLGRIASSVLQLVGPVLIMRGTRSSEKLANIGMLIASLGNLGQLMTRLSDSQADQVLKEIKKTRDALATVTEMLD